MPFSKFELGPSQQVFRPECCAVGFVSSVLAERRAAGRNVCDMIYYSSVCNRDSYKFGVLLTGNSRVHATQLRTAGVDRHSD